MDDNRYPLERLLEALGNVAASQVSDSLGVPAKWVYNRRVRGLNWVEADEVAVHFGYLPWQIWPEWGVASGLSASDEVLTELAA